jgi:polyhydroxyalkanoate synthesis regulator phasin
MKRKDDHIVEVTKEGFIKENVNIKSVISGAVAGNLLLGGLLGIGVDALSGGTSRLEPDNINVRLRPLSAHTSPLGAVARDSIEEKLDQLKKLRERGKITADEYKKMRGEILASANKEKITGTQPEKESRPAKAPIMIEPTKGFSPVSDEIASSE